MKYIILLLGVLIIGCSDTQALNQPAPVVAATNAPNLETALSWENGPKNATDNALTVSFWDAQSSSESGPFSDPGEIQVSVRMSCCQTPATFKIEEIETGVFRVYDLQLWPGEFDLKVLVKENETWVTKLETKIATN